MLNKTFFRINSYMLLLALGLTTACSDNELNVSGGEVPQPSADGVFVLCEGNYNAGNASLSYYDPENLTVENGVFRRVNDRKLGDTGQSIVVYDDVAYIAVENSGIVWGMDVNDFKVKGQLTASADTKIINPRYVYKVSDTKAYVTDLYAHYINIFNPKTFKYTGSISVEGVAKNGYCSTEEMVQYGDYVFTNCWSYSNKILVIDTKTDAVVDSVVLKSWQPKSMVLDRNGKIWVITDGGYSTSADSFGEGIPYLYRIDAASRRVELEMMLETDDANVQLALNSKKNVLYVVNNDIYRMDVSSTIFPNEPFIKAPVDENGKRHKLYGIGVNPSNDEIYVADAVDYRQSGVVYRYDSKGQLIHNFRVGITPNHFAFAKTSGSTPDIAPDDEEEPEVVDKTNEEHRLVSRIFEYMPAPGHQVNGYTIVGDFIRDGATMEEACDSVLSHFKRNHMVSLGGQGGYLVAGFDHNVQNSNGDYDIAIKGNPYSYQSEPGIIWVSMDENGDGLPNDTWYELKGSEYGTANETLDYAITYYKPTTPQSNIEWKDNQGGSGIIPYMKSWNKHDSYWQDWVPTEVDADGRECHTYYGSRLKDTHTYEDGYSLEPPFDWGYVDNQGEDYFKNERFQSAVPMGYYKISNAVTRDGKSANLPYVNFVKIQTAQTGYTPNLGEISTEVYGIWDCH